MLGLILLAFTEHRFDELKPELELKATERRSVSADDFRAHGVLLVPEIARLSWLVDLPEGPALRRRRQLAARLCRAASRERRRENLRSLERALRSFLELGLDPPEAVMTDNAMVYRNSRRFSELLTRIGARHIRTPAYNPAGSAKSNASSRHSKTSGPTAAPGPTRTTRARSLPASSASTTAGGCTAHSETGHQRTSGFGQA